MTFESRGGGFLRWDVLPDVRSHFVTESTRVAVKKT